MFDSSAEDEPNAVFPPTLPQTLRQLVRLIRLVRRNKIGLTTEDLMLFSRKLLILLSSCADRRMGAWEQVSWWDFIEAADRSPIYQKYLGRGLTRSLVAMKAEISSTRTVGYILLQLMLSMIRPGERLDRLLNGPTSDVWVNPWIEHLRTLGVEFHTDAAVSNLQMHAGAISGAAVKRGDIEEAVVADFYIAALPVEVFRPLISREMLAAVPQFKTLDELQTDWMNGVQFYLDRDIPTVRGHVIYVDSPWSLTSVSQHQFWRHVDLSQYADGRVRAIISVDISDWETPGRLFNKAAKNCTREEIKQEVLAQIKYHICAEEKHQLTDAHVLYWHLDPDIILANDAPPQNLEPLLVNTIGSWSNRPESASSINNFFLASDYVRTNTDLATMEGANEAGRRAVNAILDKCNSRAPRCKIFPLHEPWLFAPLRWLDALRWKRGLPNLFDTHGPWSKRPSPSSRQPTTHGSLANQGQGSR